MTRQDTLARAVRISARPMNMAVDGLDDTHRARQTPDLPNHPAWSLGHCALTMHRVAEKLDGAPLPETDFVTGDGASGDDGRFDTESVCYGSMPVDDATRYPTMDRARVVFAAAIDRLEAAARNASDTDLDRGTPWGFVGDELSLSDLVLRVSIHNGLHAGQLMDLRRALRMPSVFRPGQ